MREELETCASGGIRTCAGFEGSLPAALDLKRFVLSGSRTRSIPDGCM
jgi:hypothetical protein